MRREGDVVTQLPSPDLLGSVVKRYREQEFQLTQSDFAWLAGVSRGTIYNLETGKGTPDERTWYRIRTAVALPSASLAQARDGIVAACHIHGCRTGHHRRHPGYPRP